MHSNTAEHRQKTRPVTVESALDALHELHTNTLTEKDAIRSRSRELLYSTLHETLQDYEKLMVRHGENGDGRKMSEDEIQQDVHQRALAMYNRHATYSSKDKTIYSLESSIQNLAREFERIVHEDKNPDELDYYAILVLDVNSLGTTKNAIEHGETNRLLQALSQFLVSGECKTIKYLQEVLGITVMPAVAGGDEFAITLKSEFLKLTPELLEEITIMFEDEISQQIALNERVDFDDPATLMRYMDVDDDEQDEILDKLSDAEILEICKEVRATLPVKFIFSAAGGAITLRQGLQKAIRRRAKDGLDLSQENDFENAATKIHDMLVVKGNVLLKKRKKAFKNRMLDEDYLMGAYLSDTWDKQLEKKKDIILPAIHTLRTKAGLLMTAS